MKVDANGNLHDGKGEFSAKPSSAPAGLSGADLGDLDWPPMGHETVAWSQKVRGGTREDRMLTQIEASVPPMIAHLGYEIPREQIRECEEALVAIAGMDAAAADSPAEMTRFMVRTESVASSKIERVLASTEDFARAIAGSKGNDSASSMVAGSAAIAGMIDAAGANGVIALDDITAAQRILMENDPVEGKYAGLIRDEQNWIDGSDHSPRNAVHIPPHPDRVKPLMDDLVEFANRDDIPVLAQAAIAHAQFETIHPFGDGNGRIGRALIGAILRRRGVTSNTIVPVASGFNARRDDYFDALTAYRGGHVSPLLSLVARSAAIGGSEGRISVERIKTMPADWMARSGQKPDSAAGRILAGLFATPVMTSEHAAAISGVVPSQTNAAIALLEEADIVREITGRKRNRVWVALDVMGELDDLDARIRDRMREAR